MAQCHFEPQQPFTCEGFQACEGLGRVAILEGASVVMLGKVVKTVAKEDKKK
jgi:elongation factor 1-alpha